MIYIARNLSGNALKLLGWHAHLSETLGQGLERRGAAFKSSL